MPQSTAGDTFTLPAVGNLMPNLTTGVDQPLIADGHGVSGQLTLQHAHQSSHTQMVLKPLTPLQPIFLLLVTHANHCVVTTPSTDSRNLPAAGVNNTALMSHSPRAHTQEHSLVGTTTAP